MGGCVLAGHGEGTETPPAARAGAAWVPHAGTVLLGGYRIASQSQSCFQRALGKVGDAHTVKAAIGLPMDAAAAGQEKPVPTRLLRGDLTGRARCGDASERRRGIPREQGVAGEVRGLPVCGGGGSRGSWPCFAGEPRTHGRLYFYPRSCLTEQLPLHGDI